MTILPIAEREVRIAARHQRTHQIRVLMAVAVLLFAAFALSPQFTGRAAFTGAELFTVLTWITYAFCVVTGAALTIDAVSEEKREGTLGLLFLSNLRGYDVVLGKFAAASLTCFCGLTATFPVLGIPMLLGGVSFAEFSRVLLALMTVLFLSLSLGMFISSLSRNVGRAGAALIFVLVLNCFALTFISKLLRGHTQWAEAAAALDFINTRVLLVSAFDAKFMISSFAFWRAEMLFVSLFLAFLASAAWFVRRTWQEKPLGRRTRLGDWWHRQKFGAEPARSVFRTRLLERNPVAWLAGRARVTCLGFMAGFLGIGLSTVTAIRLDWGLPPTKDYLVEGVAWFITGCLLHLLFAVYLASSACGRLAEDRRSGALELLAATPIGVPGILRGHWFALFRRMLGPLVGILFVSGLIVWWFSDLYRFDSGQPLRFLPYLAKSAANLLSGLREGQYGMGEYLVIASVVLPATWIALGWVSIWTALHVRRPAQAPLAALAIVLILPWIIFAPVRGTLEYLRVCHHVWMPEGFDLTLWTGITLGSNVALSAASRWHVRKMFRMIAFERFDGRKHV